MKKTGLLIALTIFLVLLSGCVGEDLAKAGDTYEVYYINLNETALVKESYTAECTETNAVIEELIHVMGVTPKEKEHFVLLNENTSISGYQYDGSNVELDMAETYTQLPKTKEVLVRAGLVRTLVQINGVETVSFRVAGQPLCDSKGVEIGKLSEKSFIENSGREINSYKNQTITLYFTDESGTELIGESRKLYYSSNVPLEQIVIEQLLKGPKTEGCHATLPSSAKVLNVMIVDSTCYVNFDETFIAGALNVREEIPIYSIVNSIIENCSINEVQISINGESNRIFRENMKLGEFYHMNRDLIQKEVV